jgi:hypothetical protein
MKRPYHFISAYDQDSRAEGRFSCGKRSLLQARLLQI